MSQRHFAEGHGLRCVRQTTGVQTHIPTLRGVGFVVDAFFTPRWFALPFFLLRQGHIRMFWRRSGLPQAVSDPTTKLRDTLRPELPLFL